MKTLPLLIIPIAMLFAITGKTVAQPNSTPKSLVNIYEDNDFINFMGTGTDYGYTNGTKLEYFRLKNKLPRIWGLSFLQAGNGSVNVTGLSIMQVMVTPTDYSKPYFQPNNYPYSGSLFVTNTLHSSNPSKKYAIVTELVSGIRGPYAFAGETQTFVHHEIHVQEPMGWKYQLPSRLLLNINVSKEKYVTAIGETVELLAGSKISAGSYLDRAETYGLLRVGVFNPYFNGYLSRYTTGANNEGVKKVQLYVTLKPTLAWTEFNAMYQGVDAVSVLSNTASENTNQKNLVYAPLEHLTGSIGVGMVFVYHNVGLSLTQTTSTKELQGMISHTVGNISISVGL